MEYTTEASVEYRIGINPRNRDFEIYSLMKEPRSDIEIFDEIRIFLRN